MCEYEEDEISMSDECDEESNELSDLEKDDLLDLYDLNECARHWIYRDRELSSSSGSLRLSYQVFTFDNVKIISENDSENDYIDIESTDIDLEIGDGEIEAGTALVDSSLTDSGIGDNTIIDENRELEEKVS